MGYVAGRVCRECGMDSPRAEICGSCETAMQYEKDLDALHAENKRLRRCMMHAQTQLEPGDAYVILQDGLEGRDYDWWKAEDSKGEYDEVRDRRNRRKDMSTIRVRIAVAVDENGNYDAVGYSGANDKEAAYQAKENIALSKKGERRRITYVEADVPLPEMEVVKGGWCDGY